MFGEKYIMVRYLIKMIIKIKQYRFLLEELIKRDFKKKYKRSILGVWWSILSPLLMLGVLSVIFGNFFSKNTEHYMIYLFSGQIIYNYFLESTNEGMSALSSNSNIFSKINVPKYLFLFSKNVSALINFGIILCIYLIFVVADGITINYKFLCLAYPILCLVFMNLGIGLILSAMFIFFRDIQYLYRIFTQLIMYGSAIFYTIDILPQYLQKLFYINPIFVCIDYFRSIVIYGCIPDKLIHGILFVYSFGLFIIGLYIYKKYNYKFLYYV